MAVSFPQLHIHHRLLLISQTLISVPRRAIPNPFPLPPIPRRSFRHIRTFQVGVATPSEEESKLPTAGLEEDLMGFIMGKRKVTDVAHSVWKNVVRRGDVVVDATCGNGYDTLALLKMVADESKEGIVYAIDIQESALESTSSLLGQSAGKEELKHFLIEDRAVLGINVLYSNVRGENLVDLSGIFSSFFLKLTRLLKNLERERVKLFHLCHSDMENVVPKGTSVRVVVFNLGYLPGGDKAIITVPNTTLLALQAASRILGPGGLISVLVYVGHPGGRDELEIVQSFAASLPADSWVSSKFEVLNRPVAPMLVLMFRK